MSLTTKIRRLMSRQPAVRRELLAAVMMLPVNALGIRLLGLQRWSNILRGLVQRRDRTLRAENRANLVPRALELLRIGMRHGPYAGNCLSQSVTLWWLLLRRGVETQLIIGARTAAGKLEAHAWVEHKGRVLNDWPDVSNRFPPLGTAIPPSGLKPT